MWLFSEFQWFLVVPGVQCICHHHVIDDKYRSFLIKLNEKIKSEKKKIAHQKKIEYMCEMVLRSKCVWWHDFILFFENIF
jgi:hypothetical protein